MPRDTLLDFFEDFASSDDVFLVHDDGYRVRQATYREVASASRAFAARLAGANIGADDKVAIWSENRIEWVVALWGCLLRRVVLVPVDFRASGDLLARITTIVQAKAVLLGEETHAPAGLAAPVWKLTETITIAVGKELETSGTPGNPVEPHGTSGSTLAEIIFTSGATADPKGVTITHRNLLANIIPIPGGIGAVDFGLVGMLAVYGAPLSTATAAVLIYRTISLWVPTLVGTLAYVLLRGDLHRPISPRRGSWPPRDHALPQGRSANPGPAETAATPSAFDAGPDLHSDLAKPFNLATGLLQATKERLP